MNFVFVVEVEVQRSQGKFASREEIAEQIIEALANADPGQLEGENGGEYETCGWDVNEQVEAPKPKKPMAKPRVPLITESPVEGL